MQDLRLFNGNEGQALGAGRFDPPHQRLELVHQLHIGFAQLFGWKAVDLCGERFLGAGACQKDRFQNRQICQSRLFDLRQLLCRLAVIRAPLQQHRAGAGQQIGLSSEKDQLFKCGAVEIGG